MGHLEKVLIVIILATIAVITALAFLDSGTDTRSDEPEGLAQAPSRDGGKESATDPAPLWTRFSTGSPGASGFDGDDRLLEIPTRAPETESGTEEGTEGSDPAGSDPGAPASAAPAPVGGDPGDAVRDRVGDPRNTGSDSVGSSGGTENDPTSSPEEPAESRSDRSFGALGQPYLVRAGDTFRSIAMALFDDPAAERLLRDANRDVRTPEPEPGTVLFIPGDRGDLAPDPVSDPEDRSRVSQETGTRDAPEIVVHEVKKGETLSNISRQYFDTPARWKEIFEANRDVIPAPDKLRPGMRIRIPGARR